MRDRQRRQGATNPATGVIVGLPPEQVDDEEANQKHHHRGAELTPKLESFADPPPENRQNNDQAEGDDHLQSLDNPMLPELPQSTRNVHRNVVAFDNHFRTLGMFAV